MQLITFKNVKSKNSNKFNTEVFYMYFVFVLVINAQKLCSKCINLRNLHENGEELLTSQDKSAKSQENI